MTAHALTVDLEDWHQVMHRRLTGEAIAARPSVIDMTYRVLDLLDETQVKATFFVVGDLAQAYPGLIRQVHNRGHEIASHSHHHDMPSRMDRDAFKRDLAKSVLRLEDITGEPILGFRAPEFAVGGLDHWCFEVLCELGFAYDSSVFPHPGLRYGVAGAPTRPFDITTPAGTIREFPLATWDLGKTRLPVAGGGYFRLLPKSLVRRAMREIDREGRTAVLYVHPYEFATRALFFDPALWRTRLKAGQMPFALSRLLLHNLQTGSAEAQLAPLLRQFEFKPLGDIARGSLPREQPAEEQRPTAPAFVTGGAWRYQPQEEPRAI